MFYVYILFSVSKEKFYTGQTNDLQNRLHRHNSAQMNATKYGVPWKIVYALEVSSRSEALKLEIKIKKRGAKRYLDDINFKIE